jgi:hypothetical protein
MKPTIITEESAVPGAAALPSGASEMDHSKPAAEAPADPAELVG